MIAAHGSDSDGRRTWRNAAHHRSNLDHVGGYEAGTAGADNRAVYEVPKRIALEKSAAHVEALVMARARQRS